MDTFRIIVAFPEDGVLAIIKIAPHDPASDPYAELADDTVAADSMFAPDPRRLIQAGAVGVTAQGFGKGTGVAFSAWNPSTC